MRRVQTNPNSPRALRKAATRERIRAAARQLFDTVGYEATGIRDIAAAAGLTTGAIFGHYPGKAAIYEEFYGHPPITAEQGRALLLAVEAFCNGAAGSVHLDRAVLAVRGVGKAEAA